MRHRRKPGTGRLGVVVGEFPSTSETFILREMLELEKRGFDVVPVALSCPVEEETHADATDLISRTLYAPKGLSVGLLLRQFVALIRYPAGYGSALALALTRGLRQVRSLREFVSSLLIAGSLAASAAGRSISHVHAQFCTKPSTVGLMLAEILGVTFSMSCHARDIFTGDAVLLGEKLGAAEFTAVCTQHGLERLQRVHPLQTRERLHLLYHGIDPTRFMPPLERHEGPPMVLAVGRLVEKKGFDILLRAAALARSRGAQFELHFVGDGPEREDLERLASGLGLRDAVVFHGRMTQEELMPLYEQARAFAIASIVTADGDRDGIPNVLLEALAMGVPTVATNTGGIPELIEHEETGLLAKPGDPADLSEQLERILYDEELRDRVRKAGRERVALDFDITRNIDGLITLLDKCIDRDAKGA
ncbi:glycosyltransferase family 4 protein [bacterium]|nr:glycosyltransferase family 4 protein [bacterium]